MAEAHRAAPGATPAAVLRSVAGAAEDGAPELDRLIHERVRLGIVSALAVNESLTLQRAQDACSA